MEINYDIFEQRIKLNENNRQVLKPQITKEMEKEHRKLTKIIHNYELERRVAQYERKSIRKKIKKETNVELESELSKLDNEIEEIDNTINIFEKKREEVHGILLKRVLIDIKCQSSEDWINFKPSNEVDKYSNSIIEYTLKELLKKIQECDCCERHMKNRPTLEDFENGNDGEYPKCITTGQIKITCDCSCRHSSRFICRRLCELKQQNIVFNI